MSGAGVPFGFAQDRLRKAGEGAVEAGVGAVEHGVGRALRGGDGGLGGAKRRARARLSEAIRRLIKRGLAG